MKERAQLIGQKVFASAMARGKDPSEVLTTVLAEIRRQLAGQRCDLALVFASEPFPELEAGWLGREAWEGLGRPLLMGCNASGVIGGASEVEFEPALSVMALHLPDVRLYPFALTEQEAKAIRSGADLMSALDVYPVDAPHFLVLGDPLTSELGRLLSLFNQAYPGRPVVGGLASAAVLDRPGWLLWGSQALSGGVVGVAMTGAVQWDVIVAQGCRPIGQPLVITKADHHVLMELGGKPALTVLKDTLAGASPSDRKLAQRALFAGLAMTEYRTAFRRGDFLIRNIVGADPKIGALAIASPLRVGQTLQFQLRDAKTSEEDLDLALSAWSAPEQPGNAGPRGALLVSCCGRGKNLYGKPDHDAALIQARRGPLPLAGFFASGEVGPVGGVNYLHGFTSSVALIS